MKAVFAKSLVTLVGVLFIVPFVIIALLIGARAVAGVETSGQQLWLVALAAGGAFFSGAKSFKRTNVEAHEAHASRLSNFGEKRAHAFINLSVF